MSNINPLFMTTSMEPQQDITLAEIYLTPLIAYRRTSPIVAVSRADYTAYVYNTTLCVQEFCIVKGY